MTEDILPLSAAEGRKSDVGTYPLYADYDIHMYRGEKRMHVQEKDQHRGKKAGKNYKRCKRKRERDSEGLRVRV